MTEQLNEELAWKPAGYPFCFSTSPERPVTFSPGTNQAAQPLIEFFVGEFAHAGPLPRLIGGNEGKSLRYREHRTVPIEDGERLEITQEAPGLGLQFVTTFESSRDIAAFRVWTRVTNVGDDTVVLYALSSFAGVPLAREGAAEDDLILYAGSGAQPSENRWTQRPLWSDKPQKFSHIRQSDGEYGRASFQAIGTSLWSTKWALPTGAITDRRNGRAVAWQVEHNGPWRWELDRVAESSDTPEAALVLYGPESPDHEWRQPLAPGESFQTVNGSLVFSSQGFEGAVAELTRHRRWLRRRRVADRVPALVFNDYMTTLNGNPTTDRLLPLIEAAARGGAEYFCIDAGWYDDANADKAPESLSVPVWWDSVGEWEPSVRRFPDGGIERVLDHIREHGMRPGLWLEPEVVGLRSPVATRLPDSAFLRLNGRRVVENGRYFLDLRSPDARAHLDATFDRLVLKLGATYFKLDFNVRPGVGTDVDAPTAGAGLLGHSRAYINWLRALQQRHPTVLFENCSGGSMRSDFGMLEHFDLQSTSDQEDYLMYPGIAAGAPVQMLPEQAGNWAYAQAWMSDEQIAYTMVTGLSGRLYMSGFLDRMTAPQLELVADAARLFKETRVGLVHAVPSWPAGLPEWHSDSFGLRLTTPEQSLIYLWHRGGADGAFEIQLAAGEKVSELRERYPVRLASWTIEDLGDSRARVHPGVADPSGRVYAIERA